MSVDTDWDIESYRTTYESEEHWSLKQDFMEANKDRIPEDRLVCLAQVFANIELLGCRYPDKTMEEVSILAREVGQEYKEKKKSRLQRTFVKASDAAGAKVKGTGQRRKNPDKQNKQLSKKPVKFVKASGSEETDHEIIDINNQGLEAIETTPQVQSALSERQSGVEKYMKAVTLNTKKDESATNPTLPVTQSGRGIGIGKGRAGRGRGKATRGLTSMQKGPVTVCHKPGFWNDNDPLTDFVIVRRAYHAYSTGFSVLTESSDFSRIAVSYTWTQNGTECSVTISGINLATGKGDNKKGSREAAAVKVLEALTQHCYTLKVLKAHTSEEEVSVGDVATGQNSSGQASASGQGTSLDKPLEDTSMGSKLLKMMGWKGGGLGKEGTGITEPIRPPEVVGRGGLGHNQKRGGLSPRFRSRIQTIVREFTQGCGMEDLAFSPDFTKEQRAEIHKIARRFKLKSTSHGSGETRYLVLSRKFSAKQLIRTLYEEGPTDKYQLIPPKA